MVKYVTDYAEMVGVMFPSKKRESKYIMSWYLAEILLHKIIEEHNQHETG